MTRPDGPDAAEAADAADKAAWAGADAEQTVDAEVLEAEVVDDGTAAEDAGEPAAEAGSDAATELQAQLDERTSDLQRLSAEFANYRRRVERDRQWETYKATSMHMGWYMFVLNALILVMILNEFRPNPLPGGFVIGLIGIIAATIVLLVLIGKTTTSLAKKYPMPSRRWSSPTATHQRYRQRTQRCDQSFQ